MSSKKVKDRVITIQPKGISQKQWATLLLEINIMKQAWKPYGVHMEVKAPGLKNVLFRGTKTNEQLAKAARRSSKQLEQN